MHKPIRLPVYRFRDDIDRRLLEYLISENIPTYDNYACIGEVGNIHHYIMLHIATGRVLPGIWHIEDFRPATEDEL